MGFYKIIFQQSVSQQHLSYVELLEWMEAQESQNQERSRLRFEPMKFLASVSLTLLVCVPGSREADENSEVCPAKANQRLLNPPQPKKRTPRVKTATVTFAVLVRLVQLTLSFSMEARPPFFLFSCPQWTFQLLRCRLDKRTLIGVLCNKLDERDSLCPLTSQVYLEMGS